MIFKPLFVRGVEDKVDANYLLSTLRPVNKEHLADHWKSHSLTICKTS